MDALEKVIGPTAAIDPYAWWRAALAEPDRRKRPPVPDINHPEQGFYRIKRSGKWAPLRIMWENGDVYACEGTNETWLELQQILEVWSFACDNPISEETYNLVMGGGNWPDIDETVAQQMRPRGVGDNRPPEGERDQILIDIENALAASQRYKEIKDEATVGAALSTKNRLNELANAAEKKHKDLKAPVLEESRKLDRDWLDPAKLARAGAKIVLAALNAWETKKARAREDALQRQKEQQEKQQEAEQRAADRAIAEGTPPAAMEAPAAVPWEPPPPPPTTQIRGGYGRAASVKPVKRVQWDKPVDWKALFLFYAERQDAQAFIMRLANRDAENGHVLPGVTIEEERKVQ